MLVEAMTSQVSATLQNAQLFGQMQRAREEEQQFLEMTAAISTALQLQTLLTKLMSTTTAMLAADRSTLFLHDDKTNELWSIVAQGAERSDIMMALNLPDPEGKQVSACLSFTSLPDDAKIFLEQLYK